MEREGGVCGWQVAKGRVLYRGPSLLPWLRGRGGRGVAGTGCLGDVSASDFVIAALFDGLHLFYLRYCWFIRDVVCACVAGMWYKGICGVMWLQEGCGCLGYLMALLVV